MKINFNNIKIPRISEFNKKQKILLFLSLALISAAIALYCTLSYNFSKEAAISKFKNAISKKDTKTVMSLMKSSDKNLILNDKNINIFISYLNKNHKDMDELISTLNKQSITIDVKTAQKKDPSFNYYITLSKSDSKFLFFDTYYFEIKPCFASFTTTYPNTKLYVDNKYIYTSEKSDSLYLCKVPFITGTHRIKAIYESPLGKAVTEKSMDFTCSLNDNNQVSTLNCDMPINDKFLTVYCNIADAEVYINGKPWPGIKFEFANSEYYSLPIGPITDSTNAKIYFQKTFPWGTYKSDELSITKNALMCNNLYIKPINNDVINNIKSAIAKYNKETVTAALKTQNPSLITDDSYSYGLLKKEFDSLSSESINFTGNYLRSDIAGKDIFISSDPENNSYSASIIATDYFDQDYGNDIEGGAIKTSKAGIVNFYTAIYDSKTNTWVIKEIQLIYR